MKLSELKRDKELLFAALNIADENKDRFLCPFHAEKTGSLKIFSNDSAWFFKCFGCGKTGTIVDAIMYKHNIFDFRSAMSFLERDLGVKIERDEDESALIIDRDRAARILKLGQETLEDDLDAQVYMQKRGIRSIEICKRFQVGFLKDKIIKEYKRFGSVRCWLIPITNKEGILRFVKCHREKPFPADQPKAFSFPLGTYPPFIYEDGKTISKPKHGENGIFPAPELILTDKPLYLCAGELKALAMLSIGFRACSLTCGESASGIPRELLDRIKNCSKNGLVIVWDNDDAGKKFVQAVKEQMEGFKVSDFSFAEMAGKGDSTSPPQLGSATEGIGQSPETLAPIQPNLSGEGLQVQGVPDSTPKASPSPDFSSWKPLDTMPVPALSDSDRVEHDRRELLKELKKQNVIVSDTDSLEVLLQAKNVLEALARPIPNDARIVSPEMLATIEANAKHAIK